MKNKILKIWICVIVIISTLVPAAFADSGLYNTDLIANRAKILYSLGIIEQEVEEKKYASVVTKSELSYVIAHMRGAEDYDQTDADYMDMGAFSDDAVKLILDVLGYSQIAENNGGYWVTANRIGLLKNVPISENNYITWAELIQVVFNATDIDIISAEFSKNQPTYVVSENNFLEEYHDIYSFEGIVSANEYTTINYGDSSTRNGYVRVDTSEMRVGNTEISDYLGFYVKGYVKEVENEYTVLFAEKYQNSVTEISADDLETTSPKWALSSIIYRKNGTLKTLKLNKSTKVIFNGKIYSPTANDLKITNGKLTAVDNDSDSEIDVLIVSSYTTYITESFDSHDRIVYTKDGKILNLGDNVIVDLRNILEEKYDLSYISQNAIISAMLSRDGELVKGYVTKGKVSGTVSEIYEDDGRILVTVDDNKYKLLKDWNYITYAGKPNIEVGKKYLFYLDYNGDVALAIEIVSSETKYGYLYKFVYKKKNDAGQFDIFTQDGEWLRYYSADKIKINGIRATDESDYSLFVSGGITNQQIVKYTLNSDGNIRNIYTSDGTIYAPTLSHQEGLICNAKAKKLRYRSDSSMFGVDYVLGGNTKFFSLPDKTAGEKDIDRFAILSAADLTNDLSYTFDVYDSDYFGNMGVAVITNKAINDWWNQGAVFVEKVVDVWDENTEEINRIVYGYRNGKEITLKACDETLFSNVKKGDIFVAHYNKVGQVDENVKYIYRAGDSFAKGEKYLFSTAAGYADEGYVISGYAKAVNSGIMVFDFGGGTFARIPVSIANNITIYDTSVSKDMFISGTINDISTTSKIIVYYRKCVPMSIIILK